MEYTKLQYLLFKLGGFTNSKLYMILIALVIIIGVTLFFVYDYKTDGPVLSRPNEVKKDEGKHSKKTNNKKTEFWFAVVPVVIVLLLFTGKKVLSSVSAPDEIIPSKQSKTVTTGKVIWIHNNTGKVGIVTKDRKDDNPIVARVNNIELDPKSPLIPSYGGTSLSNKEFLSLSVGNEVKIKVNPYTWKYKNHSDFGNDEKMSRTMDLMNKGYVNGKVFKIESKPKKDTKKKVNNKLKNTNYLNNSQYQY